MGSRHAWKPSGAAPYSAAAEKRDASVFPFSCPPSTQGPDRFKFPRPRRLAHSGDIRRVAVEGKKIRTPNLDIRYTSSPVSHPRIAIVVPRHGQIVVKRNRLKRIMREQIRLALPPSFPPVDLVIRALPRAYATIESDLRSELTGLLKRVSVSDSR